MTRTAPLRGARRYLVCGVPVTAASHAAVLADLKSAEWGERRTIHFCNTYTLSLVASNERLRASLQSSSLNLPDGWPIALVGRLLKVPGHAGQIPGPDIFEAALFDPVVQRKRHFLFGSTPEVLATLHQQIARRHPNANIVGSLAPDFGALGDVLTENAIDAIVGARPDIVWVGLGTPLQDEVIGAASDGIPATLVAVGAAFDFIAETKGRAPRLVRQARMEWLWRFLHEPRRLWRRYLIGSLRFIAGVVGSPPRVVEPAS